jgi:hypothetical protein
MVRRPILVTLRGLRPIVSEPLAITGIDEEI